MEFPLEEKCLSCLGLSPKMYNLSDVYDDSLDVEGLLKICMHCEINKPYLPKKVCENCLTQLANFFNFKMRFINNEIMLRNKFLTGKTNGDDENNELSMINNEIGIYKDEIIFEIVNEQVDVKSQPDKSISFEEKKDVDIKIETSECATKNESDEKRNNFELMENDFLNEEKGICYRRTDYRCRVCYSFFIDEATLKSHLFTHMDHVCEICGKAFVQKRYMLEHVKTHKNVKDVVCPICSKAFKNVRQMHVHKKLHTHPNRYVCEHCGKKFNATGTLNIHVRIKHSDARDLLCMKCGKTFNLKSSLDKHNKRVHVSKTDRIWLKCTECPREFLNAFSLRRHIRTKHSPDPPPVVSCEFCNKEFPDISGLRRHEKTTKHLKQMVQSNGRTRGLKVKVEKICAK